MWKVLGRSMFKKILTFLPCAAAVTWRQAIWKGAKLQREAWDTHDLVYAEDCNSQVWLCRADLETQEQEETRSWNCWMHSKSRMRDLQLHIRCFHPHWIRYRTLNWRLKTSIVHNNSGLPILTTPVSNMSCHNRAFKKFLKDEASHRHWLTA